MKLDVGKVALTSALVIGGLHVAWSLLVLLSFAQPLLDFIFWIHMLTVPYKVSGFTLMQSLILIVTTSSIGYIGGWIIAKAWNMVHK